MFHFSLCWHHKIKPTNPLLDREAVWRWQSKLRLNFLLALCSRCTTISVTCALNEKLDAFSSLMCFPISQLPTRIQQLVVTCCKTEPCNSDSFCFNFHVSGSMSRVRVVSVGWVWVWLMCSPLHRFFTSLHYLHRNTFNSKTVPTKWMRVHLKSSI